MRHSCLTIRTLIENRPRSYGIDKIMNGLFEVSVGNLLAICIAQKVQSAPFRTKLPITLIYCVLKWRCTFSSKNSLFHCICKRSEMDRTGALIKIVPPLADKYDRLLKVNAKRSL